MKQNYSKFVLITVAFTVASVAMAEVLSPEQAFNRAIASPELSAKHMLAAPAIAPEPVLIEKDTSNQPTVYLFDLNNRGSFMLVAADDNVPALLGYSDSVDGVDATINPEFEWWISEYSRQIEWARQNGITSKVSTLSSNFAAIEPYVQTEWNQSAPYNNLCPEISGTRTYTGCVATAISQIMKYHAWPLTGEGSNSYTPSAVGKELSMNFAETTFDWDNMLNIYDSSATATQQTAVATLMYAVGVGVNMNYQRSSSGATDSNAILALVNYFRYQPGLGILYRDYTPVGQWDELVYNQLLNGPVYYSGDSNDGGHAFVCDGYNGEGYFHINWGWGGMSNGYFLLSALNPEAQGIGGSTSGYNFEQGIMGYLKPNKDGVATQDVTPSFICNGFDVMEDEAALGSYVEISGGIYNMTAPSYNGVIGVKLVTSDGTTTYVQCTSAYDIPVNSGYSSYYFVIPSTLEEGSYTISPVIGDGDGNWFDAAVKVGIEKTEKMIVDAEGNVTFQSSEGAKLTVSDLSSNTPFYIGSYFSLTFTVENNSEQAYAGSVRPAFYDATGNIAAYGAEYPVSLGGGDSLVVSDYSSSWYLPQGASTPAAGDYTLKLIDDSGDIISNTLDVTLKSASTTTISVTNLTGVGYKSAGTFQGRPLYLFHKDKIEFTATVACSQGYFAGGLMLYFFPYQQGSVSSVASFASEVVYVEAGESAAIHFSCPFDNGTVGSPYFAEIYLPSGQWANDVVYFQMDDTTGIDNIDVDAEITTIEIFNMQGVRVHDENLAPGIYVVRKTEADGTVTTEKQLIR